MSIIRRIGKATVAVLNSALGPMVGVGDLAMAVGYVENAGVPSSVVPAFIGEKLFDTSNSTFYIAYGVAVGEWAPLGVGALSAAELAVLDAVTAGTAAASKAVVLSATKGITNFRVTDRVWENQDITPEVAADTATLTSAQMLGKILVATPTAAAAYTTLTGAALDVAVLAVHPLLQSGDSFDLTIINIGGTGDDITLTAGASGITLVGEAILRPGADAGTDGMAGSGTWKFVRGAADTWVAYRMS